MGKFARFLVMFCGIVSFAQVPTSPSKNTRSYTEKNRWGESKIVFEFYVAPSADINNLSITDVLLDQIVVYGPDQKVKRIIDYSDANSEVWFERFAVVIRERAKFSNRRLTGKISGILQRVPDFI